MDSKRLESLPQSWVNTDIGTLYDVVGGGTPSTSKEEYWGEGTPWITSANINGVRDIKVTRYVTQKGIQQSATNKVPDGTLIVATRVGLGKIAISDREICFSQDLQGLLQNSVLILPEYSLFFLSYKLQHLKFEGRGTTISGITKQQLKNTRFPLPPYQEQHRIVAKIEELFSELDKGVESLKKARAQFNIYRQAVLKHAFEGKLTAKWREENKDKLEKPEQLLARIQQDQSVRYERQLKGWKSAVKEWGGKGKPGKKPPRPKKLPEIASIPHELRVKLPHLPESWVWVRLGNISYVSGGLTKNQKRNILPRKMSYLRVANVYGDKILTDSVHKIGVTESEAQKVVLEMGDLLIVEGNGSVQQIGRVAVWNEELPACGHQNHLIRVRLVTTSSPRFFLQFLLSPLGRDLIVKEASSTSGLYTLSISKVSNLIVPVAGNPEEAEILAQVEQILSNVDSTLEEIDMQLAKSKALRQSILMQAFSGQLVPQDMNDEPASVLLARIRASRGAENIRVEV